MYLEKKELYYPCSENKDTDQLRNYCEADLHLCFRLGGLLVFPCGGSYGFSVSLSFMTIHSYIYTLFTVFSSPMWIVVWNKLPANGLIKIMDNLNATHARTQLPYACLSQYYFSL